MFVESIVGPRVVVEQLEEKRKEGSRSWSQSLLYPRQRGAWLAARRHVSRPVSSDADANHLKVPTETINVVGTRSHAIRLRFGRNPRIMFIKKEQGPHECITAGE